MVDLLSKVFFGINLRPISQEVLLKLVPNVYGYDHEKFDIVTSPVFGDYTFRITASYKGRRVHVKEL